MFLFRCSAVFFRNNSLIHRTVPRSRSSFSLLLSAPLFSAHQGSFSCASSTSHISLSVVSVPPFPTRSEVLVEVLPLSDGLPTRLYPSAMLFKAGPDLHAFLLRCKCKPLFLVVEVLHELPSFSCTIYQAHGSFSSMQDFLTLQSSTARNVPHLFPPSLAQRKCSLLTEAPRTLDCSISECHRRCLWVPQAWIWPTADWKYLETNIASVVTRTILFLVIFPLNNTI